MNKEWRLSPRLIAAAIVLVVIILGVYAFARHDSGPKTTDEFFARNSHLSRPQARVGEEALPERKSSEFIAGDYQLKKNFNYPVSVRNSVKLSAMKRLIIDSGYDGLLTLHSYGILGKSLTLLAEFNISKLKGLEKLTPAIVDQLGMKDRAAATLAIRSFVVVLDPSGVVQSVFSKFPSTDDSATELKVNLLMTMFRKLPPLQTGTMSRLEPDENGLGFKMDYAISARPNGQLSVKGSAAEKRSIGATPVKAAAAGAPNLSLAGLENDQDQSFEFVWDDLAQVPLQQNFSGHADMMQFGQAISTSETSIELKWAPAIAKGSDPALLKTFIYPVDFRRFGRLGTDRLRPLQKMAKKDLLGRSYGDIQRQLGGLAKMSDTQRDQLFVEYAKALKRDRSLLPAVKEASLNSRPDSRERSMALGALGFEGSPESQAAMIEVYKTTNATPDEKQKVLTELAICSEPLSPGTKAFLSSEFKAGDPLSSDLSAGAALALGSSIARDGDVTSIALLKNEWKSQSTLFGSNGMQDQRKEFLLSAMGNSKSDAFSDQVKSSLQSNNAMLRSAAVNSLRFAQDQSSRELLQKALNADSNPDVRSQAAQAMRYQPFDTQTETALKNCTGSSDLGVKLECYRVLGSRIQQPGVRGFLESKVSSESDVQVTGLLRQILEVSDENEKR